MEIFADYNGNNLLASVYFQVKALPTLYFIRNGKIIYQISGRNIDIETVVRLLRENS
jgi:hypothetical protein